MATPWPKPVEPTCSRSVRLARTTPESTPSRCPARLASCCNSERLLPPGRAVLMASKSRKSLNCIRALATGGEPVARWPLVFSKIGSGLARLDPADVPILAAVDHVELAGPAVLEHQRVGVSKVQQHHRVGYARLRNVNARLGDNRREGGLLTGFIGTGEDRVAGVLDIGLRGLVDLMLLEPVGVAAELLFDPVGGAVEGHLRLARTVRGFEHDALRHRRDDVAGIIVVGPAPE